MTNEEIRKAVDSGKMKIFDIPLDVTDDFIDIWNSPEQLILREKGGMFVDIKRTKDGINVLSIGSQPEYALVMIGMAYGAGGYKLNAFKNIGKLKNNIDMKELTKENATFEEWTDRFIEILGENGWVNPELERTNMECRRELYDEGETPESAYQEELVGD